MTRSWPVRRSRAPTARLSGRPPTGGRAGGYRGGMGERLVTAVVVAALDGRGDPAGQRLMARAGARTPPRHRPHLTLGAAKVPEAGLAGVVDVAAGGARSEEGRVGEEGRSRGAAD